MNKIKTTNQAFELSSSTLYLPISLLSTSKNNNTKQSLFSHLQTLSLLFFCGHNNRPSSSLTTSSLINDKNQLFSSTLLSTKLHSSTNNFDASNNQEKIVNNFQTLLKFNFNLIFFISTIMPFIGLIFVFLIGILFDFNDLFNYEWNCGVSLFIIFFFCKLVIYFYI